ncbi:MAG: MBL fold metallo-hydrolase [Myxococcales bacterium]|nr:MBL fold metallo-hydrolase [Myxococcales bacterium]
MFKATFLGHQGWLFRTSTTTVLLDPLLTERFGHGGALGRMFPPRQLDVAAFPPVDAVILTHEHDDHFDVPSLHRLSRSIPVHLSVRSSSSAHALLQRMGFTVRPLLPDHELAIGDLRYRTFVAEGIGAAGSDEWDVFPFVLRDSQGHGSFVSSIDVGLPERMLEQLPALAPRPGVWAVANNATSVAFQGLDSAITTGDDTPALARVLERRHAQLVAAGWTPRVTAICGAGWSFPEERAWIDAHAFPIDSERLGEVLGEALGERLPESSVVAPAPGTTFELREGEVVATLGAEPFLAALPREHWPSRAHEPHASRPREYEPACGRRSLGTGQLPALLDRLGDYARYLYGTPLFRSLCSLPLTLDGRACAWGFSLLDDDNPRCLLHDPSGSRFVVHEGIDAQRGLLSGIELWGTDLLAFLNGELGPTGLCYAGRLRVWNHRPELLRVSPHDLWRFGHPLRRPEATASLYERLLTAEPRQVPRVPGRRRDPRE